ncbi:MAG: hypothetical protein ACO1OB_34515 [Archangium sp.]
MMTVMLLFALDGGVDAGVAPQPNDAEVIRELELLQDLESLSDFELLKELEPQR